MPESAWSRFRETFLPPAAGTPPAELPQVVERRRRQRRLILVAIAALLAGATATWVTLYITSSAQRADKELQDGIRTMTPGTYPDAVDHFTHALAINGQLPDAYLQRGNAHHALGELDQALSDYTTAAEMKPELAPAAQNGIAMIYIERHDVPHALERLNKAIALKPSIEAYYERGQIFEGQGDHQKAIEDYDKAVDLAPDAPYVYRARALAKANLGDSEGAHADRMIAVGIEHH